MNRDEAYKIAKAKRYEKQQAELERVLKDIIYRGVDNGSGFGLYTPRLQEVKYGVLKQLYDMGYTIKLHRDEGFYIIWDVEEASFLENLTLWRPEDTKVKEEKSEPTTWERIVQWIKS